MSPDFDPMKMKLCIDCRWCEVYPRYPEYSQCRSPRRIRVTRLDPVIGRVDATTTYCSVLRSFANRSDACGPQAEWFEERPPAPPEPVVEQPVSWWRRLWA